MPEQKFDAVSEQFLELVSVFKDQGRLNILKPFVQLEKLLI
jgi:hypothetical protein